MIQQTARDDRRLFKRYSIEEPVLITGDNLVGLIKDLSCGGCSFQYVKKRHEIQSQPGVAYWLCLDPLGMAKVRVQTVEDLPEHEAGDNLAGSMHLRRVKFADLNLLQLENLLQFIGTNCKSADVEAAALQETGFPQLNSSHPNLPGGSASCSFPL